MTPVKLTLVYVDENGVEDQLDYDFEGPGWEFNLNLGAPIEVGDDGVFRHTGGETLTLRAHRPRQ